MSKKTRNAELIEEIKARRRYDIIKIGACIVIILLVIWWDAFFGQQLGMENPTIGTVKSAIVWIIALILAAIAGLSSRDFVRQGDELTRLMAQSGGKKRR